MKSAAKLRSAAVTVLAIYKVGEVMADQVDVGLLYIYICRVHWVTSK